MPYFVFRISPDRQFTLVNIFEKYPEAKEVCRRLRAEEFPNNPDAVRMAFATSEYDARRLLAEKRQPSSPLEEWEA